MALARGSLSERDMRPYRWNIAVKKHQLRCQRRPLATATSVVAKLQENIQKGGESGVGVLVNDLHRRISVSSELEWSLGLFRAPLLISINLVV
jgi:hypothetical protein